MTTPAAPLTVEELHPRLDRLTVIDVRTSGEYASGHIPGVLNVPLDRLGEALPALRAAAGRGELAVVCASGGRSGAACEQLAAEGISAASVDGGTTAWAGRGIRCTAPTAHAPSGPWSARSGSPPVPIRCCSVCCSTC